MENTGKTNPLEIKMQGLLDRFLKVRSAESGAFTSQDHLDEDTLAAFVEGNINEGASRPVVSHLVDCSFCRNITAELIRLDLAFAGEAEPAGIAEAQPTKIADVLSGILTRIFGSNEGAVFAHHEDDDEKIKDPEKESQE